MTTLNEVLWRMIAESEQQIRDLQAGKFKILSVSNTGQPDADCTVDQIEILRSQIAGLKDAMGNLTLVPRPPKSSP